MRDVRTDCEHPERVRMAVALAHRIRWNPDKLFALNYPPGMSLAVTCCCHVVVDDPNFEDEHAAFCLTEAHEQGHRECEQLAQLLVAASPHDRAIINQLAWADD